MLRPGNGVDLAGQRIQNVATPTTDTDAATKAYADSRVVQSTTAPADTTAVWIDIN